MPKRSRKQTIKRKLRGGDPELTYNTPGGKKVMILPSGTALINANSTSSNSPGPHGTNMVNNPAYVSNNNNENNHENLHKNRNLQGNTQVPKTKKSRVQIGKEGKFRMGNIHRISDKKLAEEAKLQRIAQIHKHTKNIKNHGINYVAETHTNNNNDDMNYYDVPDVPLDPNPLYKSVKKNNSMRERAVPVERNKRPVRK